MWWKIGARDAFLFMCLAGFALLYVLVIKERTFQFTTNFAASTKKSMRVKPLNEVRTFEIELVEAGDYSFTRNVLEASFKPSRHDVTITSHMDVSRLNYAINLAQTWQGPMQITVFVTLRDHWNKTVELIEDIRSCDKHSRKFITWHLMFPGNNTEPMTYDPRLRTKNNHSSRNCHKHILKEIEIYGKESLRSALGGSTIEHISFYPHTKLMNIAITSCETEFFLAMDTDLTPSEGIRERFILFAEKHNLFAPSKKYPTNSSVGPGAKVYSSPLFYYDHNSVVPTPVGTPVCADHSEGEFPPADLYVVPSFEYNGVPVPRTIETLKRKYAEGKARPFYNFWNPGYGPTDHKRFVQMSDGEGTDCLYEVKYFQAYEPFFIVRMGIPLFYEIYSGYQPVDSSHVATLAAMGYRFKILKDVFLVHDGWKPPNQVVGQKKIEAHLANPTLEELLKQLERKYSRFNKLKRTSNLKIRRR